MEVLTHMFRALANETRIRVLRLLAATGESRVTELAKAIRLRPNAVSAHLKVLAAAGLVWRRRSGRNVWYRLADDPTRPIVHDVIDMLRFVFARVAETVLSSIAQADQSHSPDFSDATLFRIFTAYTHPRRLQLIRYLAETSPAWPHDIAAALQMCLPSCYQHIEKLERRELVRQVRQGVRILYEPTPGLAPCGRRVQDAVLKELASQTPQAT